MTTIAYRAGVLASDNQATNVDSRQKHEVVKLYRIGDSIIGGCGLRLLTQQFMVWYANGRKAELLPKKEFGSSQFRALEWNGSSLILWQLLVHKRWTLWSGTIEDLDDFIPDEIQNEYFAIGSGSHYALGAMAMGATA